MTEKAKKFSPTEPEFLYHLERIIEITKANNTDVVVVGGIALRSAMGQSVEFQRKNGSIPDVDMVGLGPNSENIRKTNDEIKLYRKNKPNCPAIGLESVKFSDTATFKYPLLEMLSGLRRDSNGDFSLTFRSIDVPISSETMLPISRSYGGVEVPTLPQETILHRYSVRMGYLKPKDEEKIEAFRQHIEKTGGDHLDPKLYIPYLEFCQKINKEYPLVVGVTRTYWNFDKAIGGKISGNNDFFYRLIDIFHR